jgi:hypothetical protein
MMSPGDAELTALRSDPAPESAELVTGIVDGTSRFSSKSNVSRVGLRRLAWREESFLRRYFDRDRSENMRVLLRVR